MQSPEENNLSWLNWDATFWTGIQRSQVQGAWMVGPSCRVLSTPTRASQEQRDEDLCQKDQGLQPVILGVVPDALQPSPGQKDIYWE